MIKHLTLLLLGILSVIGCERDNPLPSGSTPNNPSVDNGGIPKNNGGQYWIYNNDSTVIMCDYIYPYLTGSFFTQELIIGNSAFAPGDYFIAMYVSSPSECNNVIFQLSFWDESTKKHTLTSKVTNLNGSVEFSSTVQSNFNYITLKLTNNCKVPLMGVQLSFITINKL